MLADFFSILPDNLCPVRWFCYSQRPMSGRNPSPDESESALEPEILDPSDDEVIEAEAAPVVLDVPQADGRMPADAQAVAPVTGLQQ